MIDGETGAGGLGCLVLAAASVAADGSSLAEVVDSVVKAKPPAAKGKYLKSVTVSSTMGPGIRIDTTHIDIAVKH